MVVQKLRSQSKPGVFLNFGCGSGELLTEVAQIGWTAVGLEYTDAVARSTSAAEGLEIATPETADSLPRLDVMHSAT